MNLATNLFIVFTLFFCMNIVKRLWSKNSREEHKKKREELNDLRNKEFKTLEDQKKFLDLKYPKKPPKDITFLRVTLFLLKFACMVFVFLSSKKLWENYVGYEFSLWMVIIYAILFPVVTNLILKKFHLEDDDFLIFLK